MTTAFRTEDEALSKRGTLKVIIQRKCPDDGNVLPGRFVLLIKLDSGNIQIYKARFAIDGHLDMLKKMMAHSSQALQSTSIKSILTISASHNSKVWASDVREVYL